MTIRDHLRTASFWTVSVAVALLLADPAWRMRLLVTDPSVRAFAQQAITRTTEKYGWLISDMTILHLGSGYAYLGHRDHGRFVAGEDCVAVTSDSVDPLLCGDF